MNFIQILIIDALTFIRPMSIAFLTTVMMSIVMKILLEYQMQTSTEFKQFEDDQVNDSINCGKLYHKTLFLINNKRNIEQNAFAK